MFGSLCPIAIEWRFLHIELYLVQLLLVFWMRREMKRGEGMVFLLVSVILRNDLMYLLGCMRMEIDAKGDMN